MRLTSCKKLFHIFYCYIFRFYKERTLIMKWHRVNMYRYLLLASRIHSVAITSKIYHMVRIAVVTSLRRVVIACKVFPIYLRRTLLFFTVSLMTCMLFKYFYTRLHNDSHTWEGTRYEEKLTFTNVSFN